MEAMTAGIVETIIIIVVGYVFFAVMNFVKKIFGINDWNPWPVDCLIGHDIIVRKKGGKHHTI